jgi:hypothetical protein
MGHPPLILPSATSREGAEIVSEIKDKIKKLTIPHGFAIIPVLITNAEISKGVLDSNYFGRTIDMNEFLQRL